MTAQEKGDKPGLTVESDVRALHADGVVGGPVVQDVRGLHYLRQQQQVNIIGAKYLFCL
jgi:hypothetical protein